MKVLAVEKFGNVWAVRYTYLTVKGVVKQEASIPCDTEKEAKAKYREFVDILVHHDGIDTGSKKKRKAKTRSS